MAESRREKDLDLVEDFETVRAVTADGKSVQVPKSKFGGNLEVATENVLGGIKASAKSESDTQEVKIDPATGKLYCPPSELSIATADKLGGIVADAKTSEETEEVKVDPNTGKAYVKPSSKLDLATSDTLGGIKASPKVESDTNEVRIDTETGKLYCTPTETGIATADTFGGIKAVPKTSGYTVEAKIDKSTGKLYVPEVEVVPPDNEDITTAIVDNTNVLRFNDKAYNSLSYSGLGRTYLRKNLVDGVNTLTQPMLPSSNTRYIIQFDHDLNGNSISIPSGCVLQFDGGSFRNGFLSLSSNTIVENGRFHDVIISSSSSDIQFRNCDFEGGTINNSGVVYEDGLVSFSNSNNVSIVDCKFHDGKLGLYCVGISNFKVVNTVFENMSSWPNYFSSVKGLLFNGCRSSYNGEDGIKLTGEIGDVMISNNESCYNGQDGLDFAGHSCYNVSIVDNIFHNNEINGITYKSLDKELFPIDRWGLVDSELKWLNINISNNNLYNNKITSITSYHYYAGTMGERFRNVFFSNNVIFSNIGAVTGIHISANISVYHGVVISNNDIKGNFTYGATLSNARYFLFKGNDIFVDGTGLRIDEQNYNGTPKNNDVVYNTISAYRGHAVHLYATTVNTNVKYNELRSSKVDAINDLGSNNIARNDRLDLKIKNTMYSWISAVSKYDVLYNAINSDNLKAEYWNGEEWLNYDGTLKSKVKFI